MSMQMSMSVQMSVQMMSGSAGMAGGAVGADTGVQSRRYRGACRARLHKLVHRCSLSMMAQLMAVAAPPAPLALKC